MKKALLLILPLLLCGCLSACSRVGRADSTDLLAALEKRKITVELDEVVSGADTRTESGYYGAVRLSVGSDANGRVERIVLTSADASDPDLFWLAQNVTEILCAVSSDFFGQIRETLLTGADSGGVRQCRTERFLFSYSADAMGAAFLIEDQLLCPTEAPSVTVRVTVPLLKEPKPAPR